MKRVVVTGMGCVTPIGNSLGEFESAIAEGKNGIGTITHFDPNGGKFTLAAELKDFDPSKRLDKNAIRRADPYTCYALYAADEAVEQSGIIGKIDPEALGVYVGSGIGGFNTFCDEHTVLMNDGMRRVSPQFIPKMIGNIAAANIAIRFNAKGPCMAHTTACATSATSIGEAYHAILCGAASAMICGGSEATITPLAVAGFGNMQALSPATDKDAASLPFDKRRGGFVMGEGAGILVLEDYEHALARGAEIFGEIVGYGTTCDAHHVTAPDPTATEVARAIKIAMKNNETEPSKIYFNAHGTGTKLNDKTETTAIKLVFGDAAKDVHVSSTKSMTGHMLGAAGAVESIASIFALRNNIVPPTINLTEPDEECDLDYTPCKAVNTPIDLALSSSLGFGGHNVCLAFRRFER